jgi:hypothetical protein
LITKEVERTPLQVALNWIRQQKDKGVPNKSGKASKARWPSGLAVSMTDATTAYERAPHQSQNCRYFCASRVLWLERDIKP